MPRFAVSSRALAALAALAAGSGVVGLTSSSDATRTWSFNLSWTLAALFALVATHRAAQRLGQPEQRRPWLFLRTACAFWLAGQLAWNAASAAGVGVPFPWVSDAAWLLFAPIALAGVYRLSPASSGERLIALFDALGFATAVGTAVAIVYYDEAAASPLSPFAVGIALAYAALHSAAAATICQAVLTRRALLRRPELVALCLGLLIEALAFSLWAGELLRADYHPGTFLDLLWTVGLIAIGIGGILAVDGAPIEPATERDIRTRSVLPYLGSLALVVLVVVAVTTQQPYRERYILFGAVVVTMALLRRTLLARLRRVRPADRKRALGARARRPLLRPRAGDVRRRQRRRLRAGQRPLRRGARVQRGGDPLAVVRRARPSRRSRGRRSQELARLAAGQATFAFENRYRRSDGRYAWMLWNARPDPASGLVFAAAQDITERKQSEVALRESESRFTELVTTIPEVFFISDANLKGTIYVSPAYETIWGRSCESLIDVPTSWLEAVHEEDRARVLAGLERVNLEGSVEHEFRIVRPDGEVRLVKEVVTLVLDERGQARSARGDLLRRHRPASARAGAPALAPARRGRPARRRRRPRLQQHPDRGRRLHGARARARRRPRRPAGRPGGGAGRRPACQRAHPPAAHLRPAPDRPAPDRRPERVDRRHERSAARRDP